jgi:hypothetical protein
LATFRPAFCRRNRDGGMSGFSADWLALSEHSIAHAQFGETCDCRRGTIPFRRLFEEMRYFGLSLG